MLDHLDIEERHRRNYLAAIAATPMGAAAADPHRPFHGEPVMTGPR